MGDTATNSIPIPGQIPGTTPPFVPGQGADPSQQINAMSQRIMQAIAQASQRKQFAGAPVPGNIPEQTDTTPPAYMQQGQSWGPARFMHTLGANIKNAVAKQKQDQLLKAEGDWSYLQSSLNELFQAQQSGDPQAIAAAQKKVDVTMNDPKKLKNMAKALNQDWLNPEKTTVYGEALKNVTARSAKEGAAKDQAKQGIIGLFKKLIGQRQQPQLTPEQTQAMGREIQSRAPITTGAQSMQDLERQASAVEDLARAQKELRATPEKYDIKPIKNADGSEKLVAIDKTNPTAPYIEIKSASGELATKDKKGSPNEGKLEIVAGVPTGRVMHGGAYVAPGQKGYTKEDKEAVFTGLNAYGLSEKDKERLAGIRGASYAAAKAANTPISVIDETGESTFVTQLEVARNPGKFAAPGEGEKIAARESVHESLRANLGALDKDLDKLPNGLDTETQAMVALALKTENPGLLETLMVNKVKSGASDEVLRYITDIKAATEDILVLRNVGGMGQGSDMMRNAMMRLVPGAGSSSVKEAKMQMSAANRTIDALFKGRPKAHFTGSEDKKPNVPPVGTLMDGYKFKGGDPAKKENWVKQ